MDSTFVFAVLIISDLFLLKMCRSIWKEWSHPVFLIDAFYMILILVAYSGLKKYQWSFEGIAWITAALYFFALGGAFGKQIYQKRMLHNTAENMVCVYISNKAWFFLCAMIILGMIGWLYQVVYNGFSLSNFTSIDSLAQMNNSIAVDRYSGQGKTNAIIKILNIFLYVGPACGGFLFPLSETKKQKRTAVISMLPIILVMLFCNGKAGFLASMILWVSSFLTAYFYIHKQAPVVNIRKLAFYAIMIVLIVGLLLFTMMLRIGRVDAATFEIVRDKFMVYAFGEIQAFDCWFSTRRTNLEYSAGIQTFMAVFNTLGIVKREQGVYGLLPNALGNVFTLFRGIIEDFGIVGGLVFVAVCGCFAGYCFERIRHSAFLPVLPAVMIVGVEFFFAFGYFVSPWTYSSFIIAMVGFACFVVLCKKSNIRIVCGNRRLLG